MRFQVMDGLRGLALVGLLGLLAGCVTNPVTGEKELGLVSEGTELSIGTKQYAPSRQMQGGDYTLDPRLVGYVQEVGQRMARVSDRPLPYEFSVINDSTPNAWALPGGKIAINRGLLVELNNEAELAAVLGHEIVHAAARHGAKGMERGMLLQGAVAVAGITARDSDYSQLAVGAAAAGAGLLNQSYSRGAELEADRFGMTYMVRAGYDPRAAIGLQETFLRLSKERGSRNDWLSGLFASHPPSAERVEQNRNTAQSLGAGRGELGEDRYRRMIAGLKRTQDGYKAYDDGVVALKKNQPQQALSLADRALAVEPREALFHGLKGEALEAMGRERQALAAYDQALALDSGFFRHYLKRGNLKRRMGDSGGASRDLSRSIDLLPTADAHYGLGLVARDAGNRAQAIEHFKTAAGSRSESGRLARVDLVKLDLPENPQQYLTTRVGLDRSGRIVVQLRNATPVAVGGVLVELGQRRPDGSVAGVQRYRVRQSVGAGRQVNLATDLRLDDPAQLRQWVSRVVRAEIEE